MIGRSEMVWDNYECDGQMNIFDFLPDEKFDDMPESEMVERIGGALGIKFEYRDDLWGWVYREKNMTLSVHYGNYSFGNHEKFISVSADSSKGGSSGPMDSLEEAINFARSAASRIGMKLGKC